MSDTVITREEFCKRLAQLCLSGVSHDLPRKSRDRAIVLKAIILRLEAGRVYSEADLKSALLAWSGEVGNDLQVDHAALRRNLIDEKYLSRSADGRSYELISNANAALFAGDVSIVDPAATVNDAIVEASAKREAHRRQP